MAVLIIMGILFVAFLWIGSVEQTKQDTIRKAMEEQLMESPMLKELADKTAILIRNKIKFAEEGKELVGEEFHFMTVMLTKWSIHVGSHFGKRDLPVCKNPPDKNYDLFCGMRFSSNELHTNYSRVRFSDCGFDTIAPGELEATKNVLKKMLQERIPELRFKQEFVYDKKNPVLVYDLTHLHAHRNVKTLLS